MRIFITGGAGFIGSNLVKVILGEDRDISVVVYDNFSSGKKSHFEDIREAGNFTIIEADIKDLAQLTHAMKGADIVYHFASNPDISKALIDPQIDFREGTLLTNNIVEAMRLNNIKKLLYASGSGVYGETGDLEVSENYSTNQPISTYGASKIAGEALICAYCHMFEMSAVAFRFANVVGPNQTHGVGYDFINKLRNNPRELLILGDGTQSKSYIYITDAVNAMRLIEKNFSLGYTCYNIATNDYITVKEIADMAVEAMGLKDVTYRYTGGDRGWRGDVPIVRLDSDKIRKLGWTNEYSSKEAMHRSVILMLEDFKLKRLS